MPLRFPMKENQIFIFPNKLKRISRFWANEIQRNDYRVLFNFFSFDLLM